MSSSSSSSKKECSVCRRSNSLPIVSLIQNSHFSICNDCMLKNPLCVCCGEPRLSVNDEEVVGVTFIKYKNSTWCSECFENEPYLLMFLMNRCLKRYACLDEELLRRRERAAKQQQKGRTRVSYTTAQRISSVQLTTPNQLLLSSTIPESNPSVELSPPAPSSIAPSTAELFSEFDDGVDYFATEDSNLLFGDFSL